MWLKRGWETRGCQIYFAIPWRERAFCRTGRRGWMRPWDTAGIVITVWKVGMWRDGLSVTRGKCLDTVGMLQPLTTRTKKNDTCVTFSPIVTGWLWREAHWDPAAKLIFEGFFDSELECGHEVYHSLSVHTWGWMHNVCFSVIVGCDVAFICEHSLPVCPC